MCGLSLLYSAHYRHTRQKHIGKDTAKITEKYTMKAWLHNSIKSKDAYSDFQTVKSTTSLTFLICITN